MAKEPSYPTIVVVFKSDSPRTITPKFTQSGVTLQYSIDNGSTWTNISSGVTTASSDEIWFRGCATGVKRLYTSGSTSNAWVFSGDASNKLHVYGDLRYLLCDNLGDNTITFNIASRCFAYMFYGCTSLTTAPSLLATTLADYCYYEMFRNCTGLTTAPELPATTLANYCYRGMFRDCTALTSVPALPATTLAGYCYNSMFKGCTSLKISSTQTGDYQYEWRIPTSGTGTTATDWNSNMLSGTGGTFTGNPSINKTYYVEHPPVPEPSTTYLAFQSNSPFTLNVYDNTKHWNGILYYSTDTTTWNIWDGTTTLSSVSNKLYLRGTGNTRITGSDNSNYRWVLAGSNIECVGNIESLLDWEVVESGGHPSMTSYCYAHLFRGCAALVSPPALPATTLTSSCYYSMFRDCTALTSAPALPATTLASYCYNSMFYGCTSLKISSTQTGDYQYEWRIPTSGTGTTATSWNVSMLSNTGGTFTSDPTINTTYYVENPPVFGGFNITFEENGGTSVTDLTEQTALPDPLPTPTKANNVFVGWYLDSSFTQKAVAGATIESDVTLYAKWYTPASWCKDIADAIREKEGSEEPIKHVDFPDRITALPSPKEEETKTLTPDFSSGNQVITPLSGAMVLKQVTLIKPADLIPENIKKDVNICGVVGTLESGGAPQPDGDYLVRFIDYDGTILKEQWVDSGEDATPPDLPDYSEATNKRPALTFQGWNNSYTNITGNKDIGAIYIPTDGKTHAFVRLTVASGKDVSLYLNKTDTSTLSIDWGDNITTTHTNSGNFNTSHTYSDYGDYEIKIWISSGSGEYGFGNGDATSVFVGGSRYMVMYLFVGLDVSSIGSYAFQNCRSLISVDLPANVSSIGSYAFRYCYSLTSISIPANVSSIGSSALQYCQSLTSVDLPANVSSIGSYAFNSCYSLTSIVIPENVSSIKDSAFYDCYSLTSVDLPANVSSIGTNAFRNCYSLASIDLPAGVSSILNYAFNNCYSLTSIVFPENVSSIKDSAFFGCRSILKYVFNRTTPPDLANTNAIGSISSICKIYVPDASVTAYKSATNWKTYANYIYPMSEMEGDN